MKTLFILLSLLSASFVFSLGLGEVTFPARDVLGALTGDAEVPGYITTIVWDLRLPRAVLAVLVGAALALGGTVTQAIMRNPLAEPGILGINSGAALAATILIVGNTSISAAALPWFSFAGALGMSVAIYVLSWRDGSNSLRIILIGIGLGALSGALASFVASLGDVASLQRAMVWLLGSLQDSRWIKSAVLAGWLLLPCIVIWLFATELDVISFGDDVARGLGQNVERIRALMILAVAAIAGAAVSAAGLVSFVGLLPPHIARALVGRKHKLLLPAAALVGAILVLMADLVARRAFAPVQLPVGLTTAMLGTPLFAWLFWKKRND